MSMPSSAYSPMRSIPSPESPFCIAPIMSYEVSDVEATYAAGTVRRTATRTIALACLSENLEDFSKYACPNLPARACHPLSSSPLAFILAIVDGQNILSPTAAMIEGMSVSAARRATMMPSARHMPMVDTMLNEQMDMAPNPMMTDAPDTVMDSPAHLTASCRAARCSFPSLSSSL